MTTKKIAGAVNLSEEQLEAARGGISKADHSISMNIVGNGPNDSGSFKDDRPKPGQNKSLLSMQSDQMQY